jgi:hypothetical protein
VALLVGGNGDQLLAVAAERATIIQLIGFTPGPGGNDYQHFSDRDSPTGSRMCGAFPAIASWTSN